MIFNRKKINQIYFVNIVDASWYLQWLVWFWRNRDEVRKWMVHKNKISLSEHQEWLKVIKKKTEEGKCYISIAFFENKPVGVCGVREIHNDIGTDYFIYFREGIRSNIPYWVEKTYLTKEVGVLKVIECFGYKNNIGAKFLHLRTGFKIVLTDKTFNYYEYRNE